MSGWDSFSVYAFAALAWATGETGRIYVAGGAGGLTRWALQQPRLWRNAIGYALSGAMFARYLPALVEAVLEWIMGAVDLSSNAETLAFACGLVGMSVCKIVLAVVDVKLARILHHGGDDAGKP